MTKNFYYLWVSQILSQVTVNLMNFLLLARLFSVTGSSIATSLLWVSYALPTIFFGPIGAATVDIFSRRKTLMVTNLLQSLVVFAYYFTHESSVFLLFFVVVAYSFFNQFYVPAESAALPTTVDKDALPKANSLFFITQQASLIVGFGFAGIIEKWVGFAGSLLICSIILLIAFISVSFLPKTKRERKLPSDFEKMLVTFFKSIGEGYKFIKNRRSILFPLLLIICLQIALAIVTVSLPGIATEILHINVNYVGLAAVVPAGVGALLGSLYISKRLTKEYRKKPVIEMGLLLLGISTLLLIIGVKFIGPLLLLLMGLGFILVNIPTVTFLQEATPDWLRGRVFGNLSFLITLATIFPVLFSGVISEFLGVKTLFAAMALFGLYGYYYMKNYGQQILTNNWS